MFTLNRLVGSSGIFWGAVVYLVYSFGSKLLLTPDHRRGVKLMKQGHFKEALQAFQKAVAHIRTNPWIDRYRWIVLLSASSMSYLEMGLCNMAFVNSQMGNGAEARRLYQECLAIAPNNALAIASLKMLDAGANNGA